jgi:LSU ribosomal protein L24P
MARKIKRGDTVIIISGKNKGLSGKVLKVIPKAHRG